MTGNSFHQQRLKPALYLQNGRILMSLATASSAGKRRDANIEAVQLTKTGALGSQSDFWCF